MSNSIHPSSVIDPKAKIADGVAIGPFCVIGPDVSIGRGTKLHSHVVVDGRTTIGEDNKIFPFASIGTQPQDLKFHGEVTTLTIGDRNMIREHVTMNPGTEGGGGKTVIGNDCLFMMASHVAHDCMIGNNVIMANNATLGGHVTLGDNAILGGLSAVHQFVNVGAHVMIGGLSAVVNDVIPYGLVMGDRAHLAGINLVGLERRGFPREDVSTLLKVFKDLFLGDGTFASRLDRIEKEHANTNLVSDVVNFARAKSGRSLCMPAQK
ncbi:MAG TPA: acyl-ACP--UDP-N-acetylglucosamine O-acyltransferase [Alphaproteobacteria bacterium]